MSKMTEEARKKRIQKAIDAHQEAGTSGERHGIEWHGVWTVLPVVSLPLDAIVLNPNSHRIKAELEDHPKAKELRADPFSEQAQAAITALLQATPGYANLKDDLEENGQLDFGVITRKGLLVNANTRAVALAELGVKDIRVAVLPSDADPTSIEDLEAAMQLKVDLRQPYSYPNELLFIEDMKKRGRADQELALQLGYATSRDPKALVKGERQVQQALRILGMLREIVEKSNGKVVFTYFEGKKQTLLEIDEQYEKSKKANATSAQRVRAARLLGLVSDLGYAPLRHIDEKFLVEFFVPAMLESDVLAEVTDHLAGSEEEQDEDLALFVVEDTAPEVPDVSRLLIALTESSGTSDVLLPGATSPIKREVVVEAVAAVMSSAVEEYRLDKKTANKAEQPLVLAEEAIKSLRKAEEAIRMVRGLSDFDAGKMRALLASAGRYVQASMSLLPERGE
jgi:hypothetical protein